MGYIFTERLQNRAGSICHAAARLLFEIGHDQGEDVARIMEDAGFAEVSVKKDLAGLDRVVSGMYNR